MIAWLVTLLAPRVGAKAARPVAFALLAIVAIGLFFGAKALYDASVIDKHETKVEASAAKADRKADQKAAERMTKDLERREFEQDQLEGAVTNAPKDPNVPDDLERRVAFHRCLSLQQRARKDGREPPRCQ